MRALICSIFPAPADRVWHLTKQSRTLVFVTRGLLGFAGAENFPDEWQEGTTQETRLLFFGFLPAWKHRLRFRRISDVDRELQTSEGGGLVKTWDHRITVEALEKNTCRYTDDVEIRAGWMTPLVWAYASLFYRYRHRRWRLLLERSQ